MTNFQESLKSDLQIGLKAAEDAANARSNVDEVLRMASETISESLNVPVMLVRADVDVPARAPTESENMAGLPAPRKKVDAILARNGKPPGRIEILAEITFATTGFPVSLRWENEAEQATDQQHFQQALRAIIRHPITGEKLKRLISPSAR